MLFNGEQVGSGSGPQTDVAVDPIDGTTLTSVGPAERAVGHRARAARLDVLPGCRAVHGEDRHRSGGRRRDRHQRAGRREHPAGREGQRASARRRSRSRSSIGRATTDMIAEIREAGARVFLITDGDVAGAIVAATPRTEVDLLMGIGGTPEGVVAAAALKCLGGVDPGQALSARRRRAPRRSWRRATTSTGSCDTDDLVAGDDVFFAATGVTDGYLLDGVHVLARRRDHVLDGDALALGHDPLREVRPPLREARALLADRLPALAGERVHTGGGLHDAAIGDQRAQRRQGPPRERRASRTDRGSRRGAPGPGSRSSAAARRRPRGPRAPPPRDVIRSRSASANRSTCSGSAIVNGSAHGDTMSSVTPSAANASARSRTCSIDPLSVSARQESHVSSRIASPGNAARARSKAARASSSVRPTVPYRPTDRPNVAGSRPASSQAARTPSSAAAYASGAIRHTVFHPAPDRAAARRSRGPPLPPTQIGIGRWTGGGVSRPSCSDQTRPSWLRGSAPTNSPEVIASASSSASNRSPTVPKREPERVELLLEPARPRDRPRRGPPRGDPIVAAAFATSAGCRNGRAHHEDAEPDPRRHRGDRGERGLGLERRDRFVRPAP